MLNTPFPNAFGLDIGDLAVKIVQLRNASFWHRRPHYELKCCRSVDLPPGLIVGGELQKPEEVRQRIQRLLRGAGKQKPLTGSWVVTALPETKSFIKLIQFNKKSEELLDEDIIALTKKHIPFEDETKYYLQWQIIPDESPAQTRILIGATPKVIADSYTYLLESLNLGVMALEIEAISLTRAMITAGKIYSHEARAILDLGATRSSFIVFDHNVLQFSTSLPYSGELLTTALIQKLHLSYEEAEEIKKNQGLEYQKKQTKSWSIMAEVIESLIKDLHEAINFYYSHFPQANKIKRIIMCGGGTNLKRLDRVLSSRLKILCRPGQPWKNLFSRQPVSLLSEESLKYATAIGLALRAADNPFFTKDII